MGSATSRLRRSSRIRRSSTDPSPPGLPVEIWHAIFDQLSISDLVILLRVSRYISEVVHGHHTYCRKIIVGTNEQHLPSVEQLRRRLELSKHSTLSLCVDITLQRSCSRELYCNPILELVAEHMSRIERLSLTLPGSYGTDLLHGNFEHTKAPLLQYLALSYTNCMNPCDCCWRPRTTLDPSIFKFGSQTPNLSEVRLHNVRDILWTAGSPFLNVRDLHVSSSERRYYMGPISTLCLRLWPNLATLHVEGSRWRFDPWEEEIPEEASDYRFAVTISCMPEGFEQKYALARLTTPQSKSVTVIDPSTDIVKMLSAGLDDAEAVYFTTRGDAGAGTPELHLELEDANPLNKRIRTFVITPDGPASLPTAAATQIQHAFKQRISVLSLDSNSEARPDAFDVMNRGEGQWLSCRSLCLTFGERPLGSFLSFFVTRRHVLDADAFPALQLVVICCTHPDLPPLEEAAMRLRIFVPALRALFSRQRLGNVKIIYTRDPEVALQCTHGEALGEDCPQKWVYLQ